MLDIHFISEKGKDSLIHEELWNMKTNIDYIWQCAFVTNLVKSTPPWPLTPSNFQSSGIVFVLPQ